jgi:hypothetical protein
MPEASPHTRVQMTVIVDDSGDFDIWVRTGTSQDCDGHCIGVEILHSYDGLCIGRSGESVGDNQSVILLNTTIPSPQLKNKSMLAPTTLSGR